MGTLGTFDSFTTARLGIYAAQHGLRVTGNNISNINTSGYTRQRIDQVSFKTGGSDRYASMMDRHVGNGALVSGINQIRDPYLDIRYRTTSADTSYYDTKLNGLEEIAAILDEVGRGGKDGDDATKGDGLLYAQLQDLATKLRAYGASPTKENDTLVRGAAEALTMMFRDYANRLEQVRKDTVDDLGKTVEGANGILTNIRNLNESIREAEIHGDKALELRDERNRQIDALSEYMHIKVEYSMEDVGAGIEVEKLTIYLGNSNPDPAVQTDSSVLVDGLYATQLSIPEQKPELNPYMVPSAADLAANPDIANLKGYLFLQEVDPLNLPAGVDAANVVAINWPDADGNPVPMAVVGTNDPAAEGVLTRENDNYTIKLGKLLNAKGEEWKNPKTTWTDVGVPTPDKAVFQIPVSGRNLTAGATFKVGGTDCTVKDPKDPNDPNSISPDEAKNPAEFARFVAEKLAAAKNPDNTPKFADYDITSDANGNIIFTAKTDGEIGKGGPTAPPSLAVNDPDNTGWITAGAMTCTNPGVKYEKPNPLDPPEGTVTDPATGATVTTAYAEVEGKWFRITMETQHTREVVLDDNDLHGSLQAQRELLTEEGEFANADDIAIDENAKTKRGIPYYQKSFDLLAQQIAKQYNELNQGFLLNQDGNYIDENGKELLIPPPPDPAGAPISKYEGLTPDQAQYLVDHGFTLKDEKGNEILDEDGNRQADVKTWLEVNGGVPHEYGGPLFSNSNDGDDTTGITASNFNVSHSWSAGTVRVVPKFEVLFADDKNPDGSLNHTTQSINVNHMITMIDKELVYDPKDINSDAEGKILFSGSFNDMFSNMMGVEANDAKVTTISLNNSYTTLVSLDSSREGVSGVDLNDEAMNMMQYQKAMNAAMRLMTAIDEALDRLINNTGIAGR